MTSKKHARGAPERLAVVAKLYLAYKFVGALYFAYPIFYQFATQSLSPIQVGLFFSAIGICGFLAEMPTGVVADKRGRRLSALIGLTMLVFAPLIVFFGHTFMAYLVAAVFYGVGRAFLGGTLESLVYDHKQVSKEAYRRVNSLEITFGQAGILASAAAGGFLFSTSQSLPFIAEAIAGAVCVILIACMSEQYKDDHVRSTATHTRHFVQSLGYLFATSYLRVVVLMGVTFSVMLGMCIQFVNEAAMIEHGLDASSRGLVVSGAGVATLVILNLFLLKLLQSDTARIVYMALGAVTAYFCMAAGFLPLFFLGYLLWACLNATSVFMRVLIQDQIPGSHRSTILSSFKALAITIGLGSSTATGLLIQQFRTPRAAYAVFGTVALLVVVPCTAWLISYIRRTNTA
jgi:predicted MFS family arabinose efflux permease